MAYKEFIVGSISDVLKGSTGVNKEAFEGEEDSKELSGLFSFASKFRVDDKSTVDVSTERKRKRKKEAEEGSNAEIDSSCDDDDTDTDQPPTKKQSNQLKGKSKKDPERDSRTVFVGNIPVETTRKELKKLFKSHGAIESVRLRSAPVETPKMPKRVAVIKKQFHSERHTINAYVVFEEQKSAENALQSNGKLIGDCHIRVDTLAKDAKKNNKTTVFVGNLPFGVEEEAVRTHFTDCGEVESVRLIRDKQSNIGKGFGYVCFKDPSGVSLALRMTQSQLLGRCVRVFRCKDTDIPKKKGTMKLKGEFAATSRRKPGKKFNNKNSALQRIDKQKAKHNRNLKKTTKNVGKGNKNKKQHKK